ncbi:diguanylate cyclase [Paenibacillus shirakamiensis]|uniref:Diguanylate cyclase n=1 Tax=Paenibacillus shirakamiensis TaxID=1265935 RepID=A0ABS4JG83_9BACL|nr:diguanylate cyclase [Paenibacillus shirakamiensis]MBP2000723.1 diguanylate cyclase [Paenibacillus shirakamiensis]
MIEKLISNFTLLTTFLFFGNLLRSKYMKNKFSTVWNHAISGLFLGLFGILLMYFTFPITENATSDFRQIPILVSVYLGGVLSGGITVILIAAYRLFFIHGVSFASIIAAMNAVVTLGIALWLMPRKRLRFKNWFLVQMLALVATDLVYLVILPEDKLQPIVIFSLLSTAAGLFTYFLLRNLKKSDDLLHMMEEAAHRDFLTGLHNKRAFKAFFDQQVESSQNTSLPFSILAVDIDHFKLVNDTYGHAAGDAVLIQLADVLRDSFRPGDHIARNGGEEFIIIVDNCGQERIRRTAERLRTNVERFAFILPTGEQLKLTVSVGAATYPDIIPENLFHKADDALYTAKKSGRNLVCLAS